MRLTAEDQLVGGEFVTLDVFFPNGTLFFTLTNLTSTQGEALFIFTLPEDLETGSYKINSSTYFNQTPLTLSTTIDLVEHKLPDKTEPSTSNITETTTRPPETEVESDTTEHRIRVLYGLNLQEWAAIITIVTAILGLVIKLKGKEKRNSST